MRSASRSVTGKNLKVSISAHCGGSKEGGLPPTLEAYKYSVATGAEYVEFDIRRTSDGEFVVYHDAHLEGTGQAVADVTYTQLCDAAGYDVPRVRDVMGLIAGKAAGHLDLKETGYEEEIIALALEILGPGNFVATTLEDESIRRIKSAFPDTRAALSLGRDNAEVPWYKLPLTRWSEFFPLRRLRKCGADWVAVNHNIGRLWVLRMTRRKGIGAMVWTVNKDSLIRRRLRDDRVAVLITDYPRRAAAIRSQA
jgi:glycerophosphoryl diester phosphodiesterase